MRFTLITELKNKKENNITYPSNACRYGGVNKISGVIIWVSCRDSLLPLSIQFRKLTKCNWRGEIRRVYATVELIPYFLTYCVNQSQRLCVSAIGEISADSMILHFTSYVTRQATSRFSRTACTTTQPVSTFLKHLLFNWKPRLAHWKE